MGCVGPIPCGYCQSLSLSPDYKVRANAARGGLISCVDWAVLRNVSLQRIRRAEESGRAITVTNRTQATLAGLCVAAVLAATDACTTSVAIRPAAIRKFASVACVRFETVIARPDFSARRIRMGDTCVTVASRRY